VFLDAWPPCSQVGVRDPHDADVEGAELVLPALLVPQHLLG
jgi:hypothetical protein